ncbi:MAG: hypothetical protein IH934_04835 [Nanoarchaeota archaeon]|nr:hypothetical protein [Nanoarchaeota archaeon]
MELITSKKALIEHKKLKSRWSGESKLTQLILISILDKLENPKDISQLLKRIEKQEREFEHYIKEYPDQLKALEKDA